jgi:Domain of unknown function (DUF4258)
MKIRYTRHALHMIEERSIELSWVVQTLKTPTETIDDPAMAGARRYFGQIAERDGRWLRVVAIDEGDEIRVIPVFFDRGRARR